MEDNLKLDYEKALMFGTFIIVSNHDSFVLDKITNVFILISLI